MSMETKIPINLRFYSAHFKLDVFQYLCSLRAKYLMLLDLDIICLNDIPDLFKAIISNQIPLVYNIKLQLKSKNIQQDLELMTGFNFQDWYGGEIISGSSKFFGDLSNQINKLFKQYLNITDKLHHIGDETLTSAAINLLTRNGLKINDKHELVVNRYWNHPVTYIQKTPKDLNKYFLVHLPADKNFLAKLSKYSNGKKIVSKF